MTSPKSKAARESGELSETTKSYVDEWIKSKLYGVERVIDNKYTEKGNMMESDAIDVYSIYADTFAVKNETEYEDEWMTGTPDIILKGEKIVDIKCPWDCFTFPLFATGLPNSDYYWQLQGYMSLVGIPRAEVAYVLIDMPGEHTYEHAPIDLRVKTFGVEYNEQHVQQIHERVEQIRRYINEINA